MPPTAPGRTSLVATGSDPSQPYAHSDADVAPMSYAESYLVTDPTDHAWIIDRYEGYTRVGTDGISSIYTYPVWLVNLGGGAAFTPDDIRRDCGPHSLEGAAASLGGDLLGTSPSCLLGFPLGIRPSSATPRA